VLAYTVLHAAAMKPIRFRIRKPMELQFIAQQKRGAAKPYTISILCNWLGKAAGIKEGSIV
jgi:hypothetical protein